MVWEEQVPIALQDRLGHEQPGSLLLLLDLLLLVVGQFANLVGLEQFLEREGPANAIGWLKSPACR